MRLIAVLPALALVAAACAGDGDDDTADEPAVRTIVETDESDTTLDEADETDVTVVESNGTDATDVTVVETDDTDVTVAAADETDVTIEADHGDGVEAAGRSGELSILTYNVAGLPQEVSDENPEEHIPLISPLLNAYDIVLTQEDFDWWVPELDDLDFVNYHDRLRAEATHEFRSDRHPGPEAVGIDPEVDRPGLFVGDGLGYLSRFPFTGETRVPWEGCSDDRGSDCLAMKGFAVVTLELGDDVTVDLYNLHAEAGGSEEDQRLRAAHFEALADYIEDNSAGNAVILGGDTNLSTGSGQPERAVGDGEVWARFLERAGLTDACEDPGCDDPDLIDRIAYRDGGVALTATSHDIPRERFQSPAGEDLSDHYPVVVEFAWQASN